MLWNVCVFLMTYLASFWKKNLEHLRFQLASFFFIFICLFFSWKLLTSKKFPKVHFKFEECSDMSGIKTKKFYRNEKCSFLHCVVLKVIFTGIFIMSFSSNSLLEGWTLRNKFWFWFFCFRTEINFVKVNIKVFFNLLLLNHFWKLSSSKEELEISL